MVEATTPAGFQVCALVGRGGSGCVYEAVQASTGRRLALKVLDVAHGDAAMVRQFERERAVMADLATHPGIVSIVDAGVHAGRPWLAMDLCPQGALSRAGALPTPAVLTTMFSVATALAAAHVRGVVHCDVKPANILVTDYGQAALADFGVARLAASDGSTIVGYSLDHVAPEVIAGVRPTGLADVFSLGTTAWQLLEGAPPFRQPGDPAARILDRLRHEPLPPLGPAAPADLNALLTAMTQKDPEMRPRAADVARAVEQIARAHEIRLGASLGDLLDDPDTARIDDPLSRSAAPVGGGTDVAADLHALTHASGRRPALAAPPHVLPSAVRTRRRDPALVVALLAVAAVALGCGGALTAGLISSGSQQIRVVTTAAGAQQAVPGAVGGPTVPTDRPADAPVVGADVVPVGAASAVSASSSGPATAGSAGAPPASAPEPAPGIAPVGPAPGSKPAVGGQSGTAPGGGTTAGSGTTTGGATSTGGGTTGTTTTGGSAAPVYGVMNTSEQPPDGVYFRSAPHTAAAVRINGYGVFANERVRLTCHASGDAVGPGSDRLWYRVTNVSRPSVAGRANAGWLNAHYVNDGKGPNVADAGVPAC